METPGLHALGDNLVELCRPPTEYIASVECEDSYLYWVSSRSIGELAICEGYDANGRQLFKGWRSKFGRDFLFTEYHWDDDASFGTVRPLLKLGLAPECDDEALLEWLLAGSIELKRERISWMQDMPLKFRDSDVYAQLLASEQEQMNELLVIQSEGFNSHPMPTFREIMTHRS
ncbi:hypothetical protein E6P97_01035 [Patescibacteria group bacterium]|nr:MAG: hypothetical protein E6P97_01035 [Patescibacteria group bacterium]